MNEDKMKVEIATNQAFSMSEIAVAYKEATNKLLEKVSEKDKSEFMMDFYNQLRTVEMPFDCDMLDDIIPKEITDLLGR